MKDKSLALFDFDGTLTYDDTFLEFIKFFKGRLSYYTGLIILSPFVFLYFIRLLSDTSLKRIFLHWFFKGIDISLLREGAKKFFTTHKENLLRARGIKKIRWHREQGHDVAIVSASFKVWLEPFAEYLSADLICSELDLKKNVVTGEIAGLNCKGREKVRRITEKYDHNLYSDIYAYGDSEGDREMLDFADHASFKPFRD